MKPDARDVRAVIASVQGSSAAIDYPWLPAFLELKLEARAGRAEGVTRVNARRAEDSDITRGRIRSVVKALPLTLPLDGLVDVVRNRLAVKGWTAGDWTIRDELRQLRKEAASVTESKPHYSGSTLPGIQGVSFERSDEVRSSTDREG